MKNYNYAKIINNSLVYAPNPIKVQNNYIGNPSNNIYTLQGYKPIIHLPYPEDPIDENYHWEPFWREEENNIVQDWKLQESI